ncbi:MAG: DUF6483 family protein [Clostridium sp.]
MFKNDIMLDMIESFSKNVAKTLLNKKSDSEPIVFNNYEDNEVLMIILNKMLVEKKFNEAENTLFEFAKTNTYSNINEIGEWFYNELSLKPDDELVENNFSRYEITQGLIDFNKLIN